MNDDLATKLFSKVDVVRFVNACRCAVHGVDNCEGIYGLPFIRVVASGANVDVIACHRASAVKHTMQATDYTDDFEFALDPTDVRSLVKLVKAKRTNRLLELAITPMGVRGLVKASRLSGDYKVPPTLGILKDSEAHIAADSKGRLSHTCLSGERMAKMAKSMTVEPNKQYIKVCIPDVEYAPCVFYVDDAYTKAIGAIAPHHL